MKDVDGPHLHIVRSADWKQAVISLLEPRSPYFPWRGHPDDAYDGDLVVYLLNTDPASVLTVTARFGTDGGRREAAFDRPLVKPTIMELSTLAMAVGVQQAIDQAWRISGVAAEALDRALDDCRYISPPTSRFGHNSMAAARTLLQFSGRCEACARNVDLAGSDACGQLFAHTVDPCGQPVDADLRSGAVDWPAAICRDCRDRMNADGFTRFVDFKFAIHPSCPECGARRTRESFYGEPTEPWNIRPWQNAAGCCRRPQQWLCGACDHEW